MSEMSGGPGYWQASDGLWYPPDQHPDPNHKAQFAGAPPAAMAAATPAMPGTPGSYPARLTVDRSPTIARWRVFVHGLMAIPHMIVAAVLGMVAYVVGILSWFAILFTGKLPDGFHNYQSMAMRYFHRTMGFMLFMTEEYPPFEFATTAQDGTNYPIRADYDYNPGSRNRLTSFFRLILGIPHAIILAIIQYLMYLLYVIVWVAVLITGKNPEGLANFMVGVGRWNLRYYAYMALLTDEYPPFSID